MSVTAPDGLPGRRGRRRAEVQRRARRRARRQRRPAHAAAAGVFTGNRVKAAPVLWTAAGAARTAGCDAVVLNSGGANACTGPAGLPGHPRHRRAGRRWRSTSSAGDVAVCSTGLIGERLPIDRLLAGVDARRAAARRGRRRRRGAGDHDHRHACPSSRSPSAAAASSSAAWPRAPACSRPGWPRCSSSSPPTRSSTADGARRGPAHGDRRRRSTGSTPTAACPPTTRCCCWRPAPPASTPTTRQLLAAAVRAVCADLARQLVDDAEGVDQDIAVEVTAGRDGGRRRDGRAGRSPAATCSSAPSTARTPTGAGC